MGRGGRAIMRHRWDIDPVAQLLRCSRCKTEVFHDDALREPDRLLEGCGEQAPLIHLGPRILSSMVKDTEPYLFQTLEALGWPCPVDNEK